MAHFSQETFTMAYPVTFDKDKAKEWLDALTSNSDMRCPDGAWGVYDMLTLAGVCMMGVMSHGPIHYQLDKAHYDQLPSEHREASEETFERDLFGAITFCAQLAIAIREKQYDGRFGQVVKALVYIDGDEKVVRPIAGIKE
jgi:hypothetical protein